MIDSFDSLAHALQQRIPELADGQTWWIGLAGAPGSGKSTLATELKARLGRALTIIPMDGFHYYRHELDAMPNPAYAHARRGTPFTFNAAKFVTTLLDARQTGHGAFPSFDHHIGDPVEDAIHLAAGTPLVLVEGNYLLLDQAPWDRLRTEVFDETWYLDVPIDVCTQRVLARHIQTGLTQAEAQQRVEQNDRPNALLVADVSVRYADRIIRLA